MYHPKKHKLRVVFDCGATYQGLSLNSQLLQGPDLTNNLTGVLTRFRQGAVAFIADVEAMFHQVRVPDEDSDLLRFLWWPDGELCKDLEDYKMVVHIFGATSSPSCATFALQQCARDNIANFDPEVIQTVLRNFYVDNCLKSVSGEQEAILLAKNLIKLCATGGFKLNKWISNRRSSLLSVPEQIRAQEVKDLVLNQDALPMKERLGYNGVSSLIQAAYPERNLVYRELHIRSFGYVGNSLRKANNTGAMWIKACLGRFHT